MTRRWFALVLVMNALVLGAGVVAAAVGIADDSGSQVEVATVDVASAAEATMAEAARFDLTMEMNGLPEMGGPILIEGQGASVGDRSEMTMDMSSMLAMMEEQAGETAPPEIAAMFAEPMRMVMDGPVMYMCGGMISLAFGLDAECGSLDFREFGDELGDLFGGQVVASQESSLGPLLGARDVEELAREEVRGVPTQHVRGTLMMRDAMDEASPELQDEMQGLYEQMGLGADALDRLLDVEMPFEAWIDDEGRIRRMVQELDGAFFAAAAEGTPGADSLENVSMSTMVEFYDFDQPIEIEIPAGAVDLSGVLTAGP